MDQRKPSRKKGKKEVTVLQWTLFILLLASFVSANVTITSVTAPLSVTEGETIDVSFTAENDENETINYYIFKNGIVVSSNNSYSWQTSYTNAGTYEFIFVANTTGGSDTNNKTITVENSQLDLDITSPETGTYGNTSVEISIESLQADSCDYEINNTETGMLSENNAEFSKTVTLSEGSYNLSVNCSNVEESKIESVIFFIDTTAPNIVDSGPNNAYSSAITGSSTTLEVETDETAICKFDVLDYDYDDLSNTFTNTNSKNNYVEITGLSEGEHKYYVRCKDSVNNQMSSSEVINFYTNKKPTAKISLDDSSLLKDGRYDVKLITSEDMKSEPLLQYNFHNDASKRTISLTGSEKSWSGYIIIDGGLGESVGTFYFSGTDISGLSGTEITSGKLFLVDTISPPVISTFEVEQDGKNLKLEWHYVEDNIKRFKIYRSLESGVSYNDLHTTSSSTIFEDTSVEEGVTYYYKVAAEDEAGNEGPLSVQASGRVEPELTVSTTLSPTLTAKANQKIKEIDGSLLDADLVISTFESEKDSDKADAIKKLSLIEKAKAVKGNLNSLKSDIEKLKNLDLSDEDFNKRIARIDSSFKSQSTELVKSVVVRDKVEFEQSFDQGEFRKDFSEFALYKNIIVDEEIELLNRKLQETVTIDSKIMNVDIEYIDSSRIDSHTIITKTVTASEMLNDVSVVESIPKIVEDNADDIEFSTEPKIIKKDPVVEWEHSELTSKSFFYIISGHTELSEAKETRTNVFRKSVLQDVEKEGVEGDSTPADSITGLVSEENISDKSFDTTLIFTILGIMTIAGLLVYYFFFIKEDELPDMIEAPRIVKKQLPIKSEQYVSHSSSCQESSISGSLGDLISAANKSADNLDFGTVYRLYRSILHLYSATKFDSLHSKTVARTEISRIYSKILLYSKIRQCNDYLERKNVTKLVKTLDSVNQLHSLQKGDGGFFHSYIKSLHDHFSISAIGLGHISDGREKS